MIAAEKQIFHDKNKLYLLLNFRIQGYSLGSLSEIFHCDKNTIKKQCLKYSIYPIGYDSTKLSQSKKNAFSTSHIVSLALSKPREKRLWAVIDGEKINLGRSYKEYLNSTLYPHK